MKDMISKLRTYSDTVGKKMVSKLTETTDINLENYKGRYEKIKELAKATFKLESTLQNPETGVSYPPPEATINTVEGN